MPSDTRATTVRLPRSLYEEAKRIVDEAKKRDPEQSGGVNELFVAAIRAYLNVYRRRQIDRSFAAMAEDADYQREAEAIARQFELSDWEALQLEERHLEGGPDVPTGSR